MKFFARISAIVGFELIFIGQTLAQAPQVVAVFPAGGLRGTRVDVKLEGSALAGTKEILVSGSGIKAKLLKVEPDGNSGMISLDIASDASPGPYELRALTPRGVSAPVYLWTGIAPEINETEPNDQFPKAMKLPTTPVTVNGRMDAPEDVDWYEFNVAPRETFVIDIVANRIYSPMDAALELHDAAGHLIAEASEGFDRDPKIVYTSKMGGVYRLQVRDTLYRGGKNFVYRLTIGKLPIITKMAKPIAKRGEALSSAIDGFNLGTTKSVSLDSNQISKLGSSAWEYIQTSEGPAIPERVSIVDGNIVDPNPGGATSIIALGGPAVTYGCFVKAKQIDSIKLSSQAGRVVTVKVVAKSIGSRAMPYCRLTDPSGKELLNTEDQIGNDVTINFNAPVTGIYNLEVSTVDGKSGPEYAYVVLVQPLGIPDYKLTVTPDLFQIGKGQTVGMTFNVERIGGFAGPVDIRVTGLPKGVSSSPLVIAGNLSAGTLTLTSTVDAPLDSSRIMVFGEGSVAPGTTIRKEIVVVTQLPRPGEGVIVPRSVAFLGVTTNASVPRLYLVPETLTVSVKAGASVSVKLNVVRKSGDAAALPAITLSAAGQSNGLSVEAPAIPEKVNEVTLKFTASGDSKPGTQYLILTGTLGKETFIAPGIQVVVTPK